MSISPFLVCTTCSNHLRPEPPIICAHCGTCYELVDGDKVSFLAPGAETALDAIDYDSVYSVDDVSSDHIYRQCRRFLGDLLPLRVRSYLEIGAGTGLFTLGYLSDSPPERALVTDISPKMLSICRQRLHSRLVEENTEVSYALWDGTSKCFADGAFDLVTGFSVLHHILDYESVLEILHGALGNNGRAIFLEPSLAFHHAMIAFLSNVVSTIPIDDCGWSLEHQTIVGCWIAENYVNIKYHGDELTLERREDKHLFDDLSLRGAATRAGFGAVHLIPFGESNEAWTSLTVYMNQLPIPPHARKLLLSRCATMMPGPFFYLAPDERAPSFLVVLEKEQQSCAEHAVHRTFPEPGFSHPSPTFRFDIDINVDLVDRPAGTVLGTAKGWILGDVDVHYVQLERSGCARFPVAGLRLDVAAAMNDGRQYPPERAMCSGILEVRDQHISRSSVDPIMIVATCANGGRYHLGIIPPDQSSVHLESLGATVLQRLPSPDVTCPPARSIPTA